MAASPLVKLISKIETVLHLIGEADKPDALLAIEFAERRLASLREKLQGK
jgi:hypothetical protein